MIPYTFYEFFFPISVKNSITSVLMNLKIHEREKTEGKKASYSV